MIYFIRGKGTNYVKIGYTKGESSIDQRILALQTGNWIELELLFTFEGGFEYENFLHKHYKKYRVRGEWFDFTNVFKNKNYKEKIIEFFENKTKKKKEKKRIKEEKAKKYLEGIIDDFSKSLDNYMKLYPDRKVKWSNLEMYVENKFVIKTLPYYLSRYVFYKATGNEDYSDFPVNPILFNTEKVEKIINKLKNNLHKPN